MIIQLVTGHFLLGQASGTPRLTVLRIICIMREQRLDGKLT